LRGTVKRLQWAEISASTAAAGTEDLATGDGPDALAAVNVA
jgi:hypothetical protein